MTLKETAIKIAKSSRFKKAILSEDANDIDLFSIFVDFGLSVFDATKAVCVKAYGQNRYENSTDIKKHIKEAGFPEDITMVIR